MRIGSAARHQRAVGHITAVGKHFRNHAQPGGFARFEQAAARERHQFQGRIEAAHAFGQRIGQLAIGCGLVVKRAVRLHIGRLKPFGITQGLQRAELIMQIGTQFGFGQVHIGAAEVFAVGIARVRTDAHAVLLRPGQRALHVGGAARVQAAGDVGRGNALQQGFIAAAAFGKIGIQVNVHNRLSF